MANKRQLKRGINYICSDLFAECVAIATYHKADQANVDTLLKSLLATHSDFIKRVSHPQPGMKPKVYYNHLIDAFVKEVNDFADGLKNIHN